MPRVDSNDYHHSAADRFMTDFILLKFIKCVFVKIQIDEQN
jgi:hypothetical protein